MIAVKHFPWLSPDVKNLNLFIVIKLLYYNIKTQANAYVFNKKYSKVHLAKLVVICILKQLYSINEICNLINLALEGEEIKESYNQFCDELENAIKKVYNKI